MSEQGSVVESITRRAVQLQKRIVLPETDDLRVLQAAPIIRDRKYARLTLLGNPERLLQTAGQNGLDLSGIEIVDHMTEPDRARYVQRLYEKRRQKGMTPEQAISCSPAACTTAR